MAELTIAIPTFARNAKLLECVRGLLPQLDARCRLIVLDNHSPAPVEETLAALVARHPNANCTIIRHPVNIGGNANIVRCFEVCETPWLWVLGDDDQVDPDAITTIFETIGCDPDLVYVNYGPPGNGRKHTTVTLGQEEFARAIDVFTHSNFISACLYNHARLRAHVQWGYHYAYSCAPHSLMLLLSIGSSGRCMFTEKKIAHWRPAEPGHEGNLVLAWLGFPMILEGQIRASARLSLAEAMLRERPAIRRFARELYQAALRSGDFETSRFLYDHLVFRLSYFERRKLSKIKAGVCRLALRFPRLFRFLLAARE